MTFADFPFLRYLPCFVGGLLLTPQLPDAFLPFTGWLLAILWIGYGLSLAFASTWARLISSCLGYALLLTLGIFLADPYTPQTVAHWEEKGAYLGAVQRFDVVKPNSSENLIEIIAVKGDQGWRKHAGLVLVYHKSERPLQPGEVIWIPKKPEEIPGPTFPNEFDYRQFLARKGIHHRQFLGNDFVYVDSSRQQGLNFAVARLRQQFAEVINTHMQRPASKQIALALLLGQKESLDKDIKQAYSETGTLHILAVSGLHVGIIYSILLLPLSAFKQGHPFRKGYLVLVVALIWVYAAMTGFSPSVIRAAAMFSLFSAGKMRKRRPSVWNILAFSALLMLAMDPGVRLELGFQLSYLAVAGIVGLQPLILRLWQPKHRVTEYIWQMASVTLAAQLVTTPLTIHYFHTFPSYFLLANLLVVPLSYVILCVGVPFLLLAWIPGLGWLLGKGMDLLLWLQSELTFAVQALPGNTISGLSLPAVGMWAMWGLLLIWGNWESGHRVVLLRWSVVCCFAWSLAALLAEVARPAKELLVFASEKGTLIDLRLGERHLCWNQDFPPEQIAYSIQPNRLAGQRSAQPQPLVGIAQEASFWFPGLDVVFFPSQSKLSWGKVKPMAQENFQLDQRKESSAKDSLFQESSGFRVVF